MNMSNIYGPYPHALIWVDQRERKVGLTCKEQKWTATASQWNVFCVFCGESLAGESLLHKVTRFLFVTFKNPSQQSQTFWIFILESPSWY